MVSLYCHSIKIKTVHLVCKWVTFYEFTKQHFIAIFVCKILLKVPFEKVNKNLTTLCCIWLSLLNISRSHWEALSTTNVLLECPHEVITFFSCFSLQLVLMNCSKNTGTRASFNVKTETFIK